MTKAAPTSEKTLLSATSGSLLNRHPCALGSDEKSSDRLAAATEVLNARARSAELASLRACMLITYCALTRRCLYVSQCQTSANPPSAAKVRMAPRRGACRPARTV